MSQRAPPPWHDPWLETWCQHDNPCRSSLRAPSFGMVRSSLTVTNWPPARSSAFSDGTVSSNNNGKQRQCWLGNGPPDKLGSLYSLLWLRLLFPLLLLGSSFSLPGQRVAKCGVVLGVCALLSSNLLCDTCCLSPWQNTQNRLGRAFIKMEHNVGPEHAFWVELSGGFWADGEGGGHINTHRHTCSEMHTHTLIPNQMREEERERVPTERMMQREWNVSAGTRAALRQTCRTKNPHILIFPLFFTEGTPLMATNNV